MNYKFIFAIVFLLANNIGFTQSTPFSKEQLGQFEGQAKDYIKDFTKTVKSLANPSSSCDKPCLNDKIEGTIGHFKTGATVQTITLKNKVPKARSISEYLNSIVSKYGVRYKVVIIKFDNILIDPTSMQELKNKSGQVEFHMKGSFTQTFCVKDKNDSKETNDEDVESFTICEETQKDFYIIIEKKPSASSGTRWVVLLGDILAKSINSLKEENDDK